VQPELRTQFVPFPSSSDLVVDLFAGGGGASAGIEEALYRPIDLAINHDRTALRVHEDNHPLTRHLPSNLREVKPRVATEGRRVSLLWASPDCTHFSVAKGGKPRKQKIRGLATVVIRWAREVRPDVIMVENVPEFRGWGPLRANGKPDKSRQGEAFRRWVRRLERHGYEVQYRVLDSSLYGAPTKRRRLFIIARRDRQPILWPNPTHGKGGLPLRTAAECIDWSLPCPSIFTRKKPLADKTLWRIAQGLRRFVLDNPRPFIVEMNHSNRPHGSDEPLGVVTTQHNRFNLVAPVVAGVGGRAGQSAPTSGADPVGTITAKNDRVLLTPNLVKVNHGGAEPRGEAVDAPLSTVTATQRGHAVIAPSLVKVNHGDDAKTGRRERSPEEPLGTVTAGGNGHALIAPTLIQTGYGERKGQAARVPGLDKPLGTLMAGGQKHAVVAAHLSRQFGKGVGSDPGEPVGTIMPGGSGKTAVVSAFLAKHFGGVVGQQMELPASTITAKDHHSPVAATLVKLRGDNHGADMTEPLPTITAGGFHVAEVRAFLTAYYGEDHTTGQSLFEPLRTVTSKHRLGLVTIEGSEFQIVDIGMRMLEPLELLRAQFGDFADDYDLSSATSKAAKVRLIGNSVPPVMSWAIVRANVPQAREEKVA
jgi:DNA (cytosine-5)-methyltransferase 1